jgi:hypothetical protein
MMPVVVFRDHAVLAKMQFALAIANRIPFPVADIKQSKGSLSTDLPMQIPSTTSQPPQSDSLDSDSIPSRPAQRNPSVTHSEVDAMIASALLRQSKDVISLRDLALGARYLPELTTLTPVALSNRQLSALRLASRFSGFDLESRIGRLPSMALTDKIGEDYCWNFPGSSGHLGIALKERISVHQASIDHIPRELASDVGIQQAPRKVILWGKVDGEHNEAMAQMYRQHLQFQNPDPVPLRPKGLRDTKNSYVPLVYMEYKLVGSSHSHIQTGSVSHYLKSLGMDFDVVILEVLSNWGAPSTCLHRVRVHGSAIKSLVVS